MAKILAITNPPVELEALWALGDPKLIDHYTGCLVSFRQQAIGKGIASPRSWAQSPLGRVQFRITKSQRTYRALMDIKTMYIFSDTASINLQRSRVSGLGILEDAIFETVGGKKEIHVRLKPLIVGIGGFDQPTDGCWDF